MNKLHEKSACCKAQIIKYGKRRRQCVSCKRTWRLWKCARGRKRKRINHNLIKIFLNRETIAISKTAEKRKQPESTLQDALRRSRDDFLLHETYAAIPSGDLIMVADAVIELIRGKWITTYLMLLRSVSGDTAVILPPFFRRGTETYEGWSEAFETIPKTAQIRIKSLVCDGHTGLVGEAKERGWVLGRCHFHLLARIQSRRSLSFIARNKEEATRIFLNVRIVLYDKNQQKIFAALNVVEEIGWTSKSPTIRTTLSGFVKHYEDYRTYLQYPELHLPTTNNTAESLASLIGGLKYKLKGFKTEASLEKWITALIKFRKKMKCNGFHQPN